MMASTGWPGSRLASWVRFDVIHAWMFWLEPKRAGTSKGAPPASALPMLLVERCSPDRQYLDGQKATESTALGKHQRASAASTRRGGSLHGPNGLALSKRVRQSTFDHAAIRFDAYRRGWRVDGLRRSEHSPYFIHCVEQLCCDRKCLVRNGLVRCVQSGVICEGSAKAHLSISAALQLAVAAPGPNRHAHMCSR